MTKDVVLASLIERKSTPSDDINVISIEDTVCNDIFHQIENLTPPELVEEFEKEFRTNLGAVSGEAMEISPNAVFFKKEGNNKTEIDLILKEHSYCTKK